MPDLAACGDYDGAAAAAAKVTCPVRFVLGESDRMTAPRATRPLAEKIAQSSTIMVPDAGHLMMVEQSGRTLDALRDFV